ncbi:MAG: hypothetical protein KC435_14240 [Thermomicrobiales bacterium]|nr:hypothetical protein [Thermomicrobiales bacterium]
MIPDPTKMPPEDNELDGMTPEEEPLSEIVESPEPARRRNTDTTLAMGVAIGVAVGALFGTIQDNLALGVGIGIAAGVILAWIYLQFRTSNF